MKVSVLRCVLLHRWWVKEVSNWRPASTIWCNRGAHGRRNTHSLVISVLDCVIFQHRRSRLGRACPAVSLRREYQQWPKKLETLIGARLEQSFKNQRDMLANIVEWTWAYCRKGLTIGYQMKEFPSIYCSRSDPDITTSTHNSTTEEEGPAPTLLDV